MNLHNQIVNLFLLALPIACITWTVTHEEVFREFREYCEKESENSRNSLARKFFYLFTCEYCFSHYIVLFFLLITRYHLGFDDWRGYLIGGFALVWIANIYMAIFGRVRLDIKKVKVEANLREEKLKAAKKESSDSPQAS